LKFLKSDLKVGRCKMALNRRTIILIVIAIVVWGLAIVVLWINYGPKKSIATTSTSNKNTNTQVQQAQQNATINSQVQSGMQNNISNNSTQLATSTSQSSTDLSFNVFDISSLAEVRFTAPDIFEPYFIDLKALLENKSATSGREYGSVGSKPTTTYQNIEDITSDAVKYHGYIKLNYEKGTTTKVYMTIDGETKSYNVDEVIEGKYKVVGINSRYLIVLDTNDGKVKRIRVSE